jgi:hypothetical protein
MHISEKIKMHSIENKKLCKANVGGLIELCSDCLNVVSSTSVFRTYHDPIFNITSSNICGECLIKYYSKITKENVLIFNFMIFLLTPNRYEQGRYRAIMNPLSLKMTYHRKNHNTIKQMKFFQLFLFGA